MIKFDPAKIQFEYVYIRKIFKSFVEIISDVNGNTYESSFVEYKRLKDGSVQIPIHYKVFSLYLKNNSLLEFNPMNGRKACIFYYDGKVLLVDVYRINYFGRRETESEWKSVNESIFAQVKKVFKDPDETYIDGESIFFIDKTLPVSHFKTTKNFYIQAVRYIDLSKMGIKKYISNLFENNTDSKENSDEGDSIANSSIMILKSGFVLAYNPYRDIDPLNEEVIVYSCVFKSLEKKKQGKNSKWSQDESCANLLKIENPENPLFFNLNFVLRAAKVIGEHFDFDETDFLNIPQLILDTGIINLKSDISRQSRDNYPVSLNVWDCFAYIMRYCYLEKDLNNYRDFVNLFKFAVTKGFVSKKNTGDLFQEGKGLGDITHYKIKTSTKKKKELVLE